MATTTSLRRWGTVLVATLVGPAALIAACSSDNANPQPPPVYTVNPDSGQQPPTKTDDAGIDVVSPPDDSLTGPNPDAPLTQKDGALVGDAASCATDSGCWSCTPATPTEFLNQCTSSQCSPFSNTTRLPNYDGGLPPLN